MATNQAKEARALVERIKEHAEMLLALVEHGASAAGASDPRSPRIAEQSLASLREACLLLADVTGVEGWRGRLVRAVEVACEAVLESREQHTRESISTATRRSIEALGEFHPDLAKALLASRSAMKSLELAVSGCVAGVPMRAPDGSDDDPRELKKIPRNARAPWLVHVSDASAQIGDRVAPEALDRKARKWRSRHPEEA